MRKLTFLIITVTGIGLSASPVRAGKMKDGMMEEGKDGKGMDKGMMMGKGMMGNGMMDGDMMSMMKMMHKMHGMMRSPTMVSSSDGGVIVLTSNKLYKYDKNLTLVKEAEVKMDMDGGMMGGMGGKKMCPMCAKMKGKDGTTDEAAEGEAAQPAQEDADHKSHH